MTDDIKRTILQQQIQQAANTAFQHSSLAKAFVEAGLTEEGKQQAESASKFERVALALQKQIDALG